MAKIALRVDSEIKNEGIFRFGNPPPRDPNLKKKILGNLIFRKIFRFGAHPPRPGEGKK